MNLLIITVISWLELLNMHIPALIVFKIVYCVLWWRSYSPIWNRFCCTPITILSLFYRYFIDKCSGKLNSCVLSIQIFTPRTNFAISTELNYPHFLLVPKCKKYVPLRQHFPQEHPRESRVGYFPERIDQGQSSSISHILIIFTSLYSVFYPYHPHYFHLNSKLLKHFTG